MVLGTQLALIPRWELVMVRSGEEVGPLEGILVGLSWFITIKSLFSNASTMLTPLLAAASSAVEEYQRASWALKSPIIRVSPVALKREVKLGWYPGHEAAGGM